MNTRPAEASFRKTSFTISTKCRTGFGQFSVWLAGGGVKAGTVHGETDEFGYNITAGGMHIHDLQATVLHLLGIDHERLTYRHGGRDFRLTDVEGNVVREILA